MCCCFFHPIHLIRPILPISVLFQVPFFDTASRDVEVHKGHQQNVSMN